MLSPLRLIYLLTIAVIPCRPATASAVRIHSTATGRPLTLTAGWHYESKSDKRTGSIYKATLNAVKPVQFPYPYAGGSTVSLILRNRNGQTNAYLSTARGVFTRSFQGGNAQVCFGNGKPVVYALTAAENGSGNTIFFDAAQQLIRQIRTAKTMTIRVRCADLILDELQFKTAGLRWDH